MSCAKTADQPQQTDEELDSAMMVCAQSSSEVVVCWRFPLFVRCCLNESSLRQHRSPLFVCRFPCTTHSLPLSLFLPRVLCCYNIRSRNTHVPSFHGSGYG